MPACFGLPPCVDDWRFAFANHIVVPVPSLWVDWLAHCAEHFDGREVIFLNKCLPLTHQRTNGRWGSVELIDLVFLANRPKPSCVWIGGHTFEHQGCRAVGQGAIDDIAVAGHPAHICGTPKHIPVLIVEGVLMGHGGINEVATGGVYDAFRRTG